MYARRKFDRMNPQNAASVHWPHARVFGTRFVFAFRAIGWPLKNKAVTAETD